VDEHKLIVDGGQLVVYDYLCPLAVTPEVEPEDARILLGLVVIPLLTIRHHLQANKMDITLDLPFLHIHNSFTNERTSIYLDKHSCMSLDTKDYFVTFVSK